MTDKQIIINGVDISKCKHYDEVFNYCDQSYLGEGGLLKNTKNPKRCECSPNCYYKQLKRKEQNLQEAIDTSIKEFNRAEELKTLLKRKEQECEKAKQNAQDTYDLWQALIESFNILQGEKIKLEQECEELKKQLERKEENYQKLLSKSNKYIHNLVDENVQDISNLGRQLAQLKEENDRLRKRIVTIFDCLIKANRDVIVDTLWVDNITTLWDYIAQTLGIEGDQNQIEEQVKMLYSEGE